VTYSPSSAATPHSLIPRKGHERLDTVAIYTHADMSIKERALARTKPLHVKPGRYRPRDRLLAFLDSL
jgi:integrase/recombinase XerD